MLMTCNVKQNLLNKYFMNILVVFSVLFSPVYPRKSDQTDIFEL